MPNAIVVLIASFLSALGAGKSFVSPSTELDDSRMLGAPRGAISFYFENRKETLALALFGDAKEEGIAPSELHRLSHFVRCYRTDRERPIHPRLAEIVARVAEAFGRDSVDVISGFRAPPFGAPHSKHFLGRAMDLHFPGVPSKKVAAWVWKNFRGVGVGVYPNQDFVHIDVREVDVRWVDGALHGESAHARYFGRGSGEHLLPDNAPKLLYDEPPAVASAATLDLPAVAALHGTHLPAGISDGY